MKGRLPRNFIRKCQPAIRANKRERVVGGIITGIKKDWIVQEKEEKERRKMVRRRIKICEKKWAIVSL